MRHLVIRMVQSNEAIGIVKVPDGKVVNGIYRRETKTAYVDEILKVEYTTYEAFGLFPVFNWFHTPEYESEWGFVSVYNAELFYVKEIGSVETIQPRNQVS